MRGDKYFYRWLCLQETLAEYMAKEKEENYLDELLQRLRQSERGHVAIYKEAGMDRRYFSKLVSGQLKLPSKKAMIRLGLAMHLDLEGMQRLLHSCGYHLSASVDLDLVVMYCISQGKYDLWQVNDMLYELDLPLLE